MKHHITYLIGTIVLLIVVAIWIISSRYQISNSHPASVYRIDRWTGKTWRFEHSTKTWKSVSEPAENTPKTESVQSLPDVIMPDDITNPSKNPFLRSEQVPDELSNPSKNPFLRPSETPAVGESAGSAQP